MSSDQQVAVNLIVSFIVGAFTFAAALAWNNMIQTVIKKHISDENSVKASIIYTLTVTTLAVVVILFLNDYVIDIVQDPFTQMISV